MLSVLDGGLRVVACYAYLLCQREALDDVAVGLVGGAGRHPFLGCGDGRAVVRRHVYRPADGEGAVARAAVGWPVRVYGCAGRVEEEAAVFGVDVSGWDRK